MLNGDNRRLVSGDICIAGQTFGMEKWKSCGGETKGDGRCYVQVSYKMYEQSFSPY
jgi:hypothetical protein